jgi:Rod binding domain-containing protein
MQIDPILELTAGPRAQAEQVAGRFEQIFAQQLVASMREGASLGESSGLFGDGPGSDTFTMWFDSLLGERLGQQGLGVAGTLLRDWERQRLIPPATTEAPHAAG